MLEPIPLKPITDSEIKRIFRSKEFRELLRASALFTYKTGYLSGFEVLRNIHNNQLRYSELSKGTTNEVQVDAFRFGLFDYPVIHLYFRPDINPGIIPTGPIINEHNLEEITETDEFDTDLTFANLLRKTKRTFCKPLYIIGQIDEKRKGELLLLQERFRSPMNNHQIAEAYLEVRRHLERYGSTTDEVSRAFAQTRVYNSTEMKFELVSKKRNLRLSRKNEKSLEQFAYTPSLKPETAIPAQPHFAQVIPLPFPAYQDEKA